jgi:predicted DNA-binding protein
MQQRSRKTDSRKQEVMTVPLRLPKDMRDQVRAVSDKSGLTDAAVMRLALERGLGAVEKMFQPQPTEQAA